MILRAIIIAALALLPRLALAQGAVQQQGPVTPGHLAMWQANGRIADAGQIPGTINQSLSGHWYSNNGGIVDRLADRAFFGGAVLNDGSGSPMRNDWFSVLEKSWGLGQGACDFAVICSETIPSVGGSGNGTGSTGVLGAAQSFYSTSAGTSTIGLFGAGVTNNTTYGTSSWGGYFEDHVTAAPTGYPVGHGVEIEQRVLFEPYTPNAYAQAVSSILQLGCGAGLSATGQYDCSAFIQLIKNPKPAHTGIVAIAGSIDTSLGNGGGGKFAELGDGMDIIWRPSTYVIDEDLYADQYGLISSNNIVLGAPTSSGAGDALAFICDAPTTKTCGFEGRVAGAFGFSLSTDAVNYTTLTSYVTTLALGASNSIVLTLTSAGVTDSGHLTLSGLDTGTQVSCLGLTSGNAVVAASGACGSGGGGGSLTVTDGTNTVTSTTTLTVGTGFVVGGSAGSATVNLTQILNTQAGATYTVLSSDAAKTVLRTDTAAMTDAVPRAVSSFGAGFGFALQTGAYQDTLTSTTSTINGIAGLTGIILRPYQNAQWTSDGTNWWVAYGMPQSLQYSWIGGANNGLFVGQASVTPLTSWQEVQFPNTASVSQITGLASWSSGGYGVIGTCKTDVNTGAYCFGVGDFVWNDSDSTSVATAAFGQAKCSGQGTCISNEQDILNFGGPNPYNQPYAVAASPLSAAYWAGSGDPGRLAWSGTGSIASTTLTIGAPTEPIATGEVLAWSGSSGDTWIVNQLTGSSGGAGTYLLNKAKTVSSQTISFTPLDASVGYGLINNTTGYKTGFLVHATALAAGSTPAGASGATGADADTYIRDAISLPRMAAINFWTARGSITVPPAQIYSAIPSTVPNAWNLRFDGTGVEIETNNSNAAGVLGLRVRPASAGTCYFDMVNGAGATTLNGYGSASSCAITLNAQGNSGGGSFAFDINTTAVMGIVAAGVGIGTTATVPLQISGGAEFINGGASFGVVPTTGEGLAMSYDTTAHGGIIVAKSYPSTLETLNLEASSLFFTASFYNFAGITTGTPATYACFDAGKNLISSATAC